jgi:hypothetical protein
LSLAAITCLVGLAGDPAWAGGHHRDRVYLAAPTESRVIERVYTVAPATTTGRYLLLSPASDGGADTGDRSLTPPSGKRGLGETPPPLLRTVTDPSTGELRPAPIQGGASTRSLGGSTQPAPSRTYREGTEPVGGQIVYRRYRVVPVEPVLRPIAAPFVQTTTVVREVVTVRERTNQPVMIIRKKHGHK